MSFPNKTVAFIYSRDWWLLLVSLGNDGGVDVHFEVGDSLLHFERVFHQLLFHLLCLDANLEDLINNFL